MRRGRLVLGSALLAASLAGCPDPEVVVETRSAVEHGQELLSDPKLSSAPGNHLACSDCHGEAGGGTTFSGGSLAGATERASYWAGKEPTLLGAINHCLYYFMLHDQPWDGSEPEARALYAYLETQTGSPDPVPFTLGEVVDPGMGDGARGKLVYEAACRTCHGDKGTGTNKKTPNAPSLPEQTLAAHPLGEYTAEERRLVFVEKTRHGTFLGYGGQMPPLSIERLSNPELADLLTYLGVP